MSPPAIEFDCERTCKSRQHGAWCVAAVIRGSDDEVLAAIQTKCQNFANVWDSGGKNVLHAAASCGKRKIVEWLVRVARARINAKDLESGYTSLHRSLFYGQLNCAVELIRLGCNVGSVDHEGLTSLEIALLDRPGIVDLNPRNPCEIYAWGTNSNYNLGVGHDQTRAFPEVSEHFRQKGVTIKQVSMDKFHTLFVGANDGAVYSCGHGTGGRLGHGTERPQLEPKLIQMPVESPVVQAFAAANHSVFLLENGLVLACGSNQFGQLGQPQQTTQLDTPKVLPWFKAAKSGPNTYDTSRGICGLATSRFHVAFFCQKVVYSFGLNGGQLGHAKVEKEKIIWAPRKVTTLDLTQDGVVTGIAASEGSTVVTVKRDTTGFSDVYALHEYQCRKVASKLAGDLKVSVVGGNLDAKVAESSGLIEHGGSDLRIMILAAGDRLLLWRGAHNHLTRVVLNAPRSLTISDALLTKSGVAMVTRSGQAYIGQMSDKPSSGKAQSLEQNAFRSSYTRVIGGKVGVGAADDKIYQYPPEIVKVERVPGIWRAVTISADPKGRNFVALQATPKEGLFELPEIAPSTMSVDMRNFFEETGLNDKIHDVVLRIDGKEYPAHWFILRTRCPFFNKLYQSADWSAVPSSEPAEIKRDEPSANDDSFSMFGYASPFANGRGDFDPLAFEAEMDKKVDKPSVPTVDVDILKGVPPKIIEQLLLFIYSGTCDLTNEGGCPFKIPATSDKNSKFIVRPVKAPANPEARGRRKAKQKKPKNDDHAAVEEVVDYSPVLNPVAVLADVAEKLGWKQLRSVIAAFEFSPPSAFFPFGLINKRSGYRLHRLPDASARFFRQDYPELQDLVIVSGDGVELIGHQCILAARLQYFRSLLGISGGGWFESSRNRVTMPLPADLLEIVIDFLYSDSTPDGVALARDPGIPANVLVVADQLLIDRLKNMCEVTLVNHLTLKNVAELLDFSDTYNARQLKNSCFQFVSLNASAILESRCLESVGETRILDELAEYYRSFVLRGGKRRLTPYFSVGPSFEELQVLKATFGTKIDDILTEINAISQNGDILAAESSEALKIKVSGSKTPSKKRLPPRIRKESQTTIKEDKHEEEPSFSAAIASTPPKPKIPPPEPAVGLKKKNEEEKTVVKKSVRVMPAPVTPQKMAEREAAMAASNSQTSTASSPSFTTFRLSKPSTNGSPVARNDENAFPSLGAKSVARRNSGVAAEVASSTSPTSSSAASPPGRSRVVEPIPIAVKTKLSQKQRKKLASGGHDEEHHVSPPRQAEPEVTPTKPVNAWSTPLPWTSKPLTSPGSEVTNKLANMSFEELPAVNGQRRKSTRKSEPSEDSFTQILQEEMERRENLERIKMKPLSTIQKEDQAIDELLRYYNAEGNAEERITVIRSGPSDFAAPVWHKKSSAGGGAQRLN